MILTIRFYVPTGKLNSAGKCPIRCRITYRKMRKEFSTRLFVEPRYWDSKKQKLLEEAESYNYITTQLSLIKNKLNQAFLFLQVQHEGFTVEDIYLIYRGDKVKKDYQVIEYFEVFLERLKMLVGVDLEQVTWNKFMYIRNDVRAFIFWKFKRTDYPLDKLKLQFLHDFEYYLKTEKNQKQITINKSIQRFRKVIKNAVGEGYLDKEPFMLFKPKPINKEVVFLSPEELKDLEQHNFSQPRLHMIRNLFVFCCYTGLAYAEMSALRADHIVKGFDGQQWIEMKRKKTKKMVRVPLLPKALQIIALYKGDEEVLPRISNQRFNSYMKEIAAIVGIEKRLTHHTARKTFASTVLLFNDVPMEIVSELLGHSSISVTQAYYGKIVQRKVGEEMRKLKG